MVSHIRMTIHSTGTCYRYPFTNCNEILTQKYFNRVVIHEIYLHIFQTQDNHAVCHFQKDPIGINHHESSFCLKAVFEVSNQALTVSC